MKKAFDGFISRLHMAEERISELEGITIKTESKEKKRLNKTRREYSTTKVEHIHNGNVREGDEEKKQKQYLKQ